MNFGERISIIPETGNTIQTIIVDVNNSVSGHQASQMALRLVRLYQSIEA